MFKLQQRALWCVAFSFSCVCQSSELGGVEVMGGALLVPELTLKRQYLDNLLLQPENPVSTQANVLRPQLSLLANNSGRFEFVSRIAGESVRYTESEIDNYNNVSAAAEVDWQISSRNQFSFSSGFSRQNERRGTAFSAGRAAELVEPDTYKVSKFDGTYIYGAETARGRLEFSLGRQSREYVTRRELTADRDRDKDYLSTAFFLNFAGRGAAVVELISNATRYRSETDDAASDARFLDSQGRVLLTGFTWRATAKTEGDIRVGYAEKDFNNPQVNNFSGLSWQASGKWLPKSHSAVYLRTGRRPIETDGSGVFIDEQTWLVDWQHKWTSRFKTRLSASYVDRDYEGDFNNREETQDRLSLSWDYTLNRWCDIALLVARENKRSNLSIFEFKSNLAELSVNLSL